MGKHYTVQVKEVSIKNYNVFADSEEEALEKHKNSISGSSWSRVHYEKEYEEVLKGSNLVPVKTCEEGIEYFHINHSVVCKEVGTTSQISELDVTIINTDTVYDKVSKLSLLGNVNQTHWGYEIQSIKGKANLESALILLEVVRS